VWVVAYLTGCRQEGSHLTHFSKNLPLKARPFPSRAGSQTADANTVPLSARAEPGVPRAATAPTNPGAWDHRQIPPFKQLSGSGLTTFDGFRRLVRRIVFYRWP
jgi:hypothetical protein